MQALAAASVSTFDGTVMSKLGRVVEAVENYNAFVLDEVKRARSDKAFGQNFLIAGTR